MAYIPLEEHLPGITGLLEYSKETAGPIRELTQIPMRGPSTLSEGERELIATVVSSGNESVYCTPAQTAVANTFYTDPSICELAKKDSESNNWAGESGSRSPPMYPPRTIVSIASMPTRWDGPTLAAM